mgnify:CR=1 FL=1
MQVQEQRIADIQKIDSLEEEVELISNLLKIERSKSKKRR